MEGNLYVELSKGYEEMFCTLQDSTFTAYKRARSQLPPSAANKGAVAIKFEIRANEFDCKNIKFGLADLSKIMKTSKLAETPYFFNVTAGDTSYILAAHSEEERSQWMRTMKSVATKERKAEDWMATGFLDKSVYPQEPVNRFASVNQMPSSRMGQKATSDRPLTGSSNRINVSDDDGKEQERDSRRLSSGVSDIHEDHSEREYELTTTQNIDDVMKEEEEVEADVPHFLCFRNQETIMHLRVDTIVRLVKVCLAFPFIIVLSTLNLSNRYRFLRTVVGVRVMNILIYVAPVVYVRFVLSQYDDVNIQRIAIGFYILIYLLPVGLVVSSKVRVSSSTSKIEDGTFCFKPARTVRFTQANFYALFGFVMEWIQHILYVLPLGVVTSSKQTKLSDFPPYLTYEVYFWIAVVSTFLCGLIIILNSVLKGKLHYRFQRAYLVWFFLYNVGSPLFVTIVTILFMSLVCDYSQDPPVLVQQPSIVCYDDQHIAMVRAALMAVAVYIIQHTLLPSGTFKETMRDNDLEIMFVPVYLQAHYLLKAVFSGVYVLFYEANYTRVIVLTIINMMLLALNNFMKPCSVAWVNLLRDGFFIHASLSGIISINYLCWPENTSMKSMLISTLASTVLFSTVGMYVYYHSTARSTEYNIASAFLDLEWQVSRGGSVHPRVLEPLISLTLSTEKDDWEIAKKYIPQLVWLIKYPNMRVQFQSAWGLANLALLEEDARVKIFESGGTKTLFEWYMEMDFVVQLEALAAMANLTLSLQVAEDLVTRHKCIPFFLTLVSSNKLKHSQFATIAIGNLARKEAFREMIRKHNGIPALVSCIMSHDYQKRRHGCRALANMALSPSKEIEQVFESRGLIDRILKMALRKEIETQREVVALIRNLACHARLRPLMLDRGVMSAVEASKSSVFEDVRAWCDEITLLLQREITGGAIDLKALMRREGAKGSAVGDADVDLLKKMEPLQGKVEWSTWGSKLESIFEPVFSTVPSIQNSQLTVAVDSSILVHLPVGIRRKDLKRWRDSLSYSVLERPAHGKLSEYNTAADYVTYTPSPGYVGADFFTYRMLLGTVFTAPATVALKIVDGVSMPMEQRQETEDMEAALVSKDRSKGMRQVMTVELTDVKESKREKESTPFMQSLMKKTSLHEEELVGKGHE